MSLVPRMGEPEEAGGSSAPHEEKTVLCIPKEAFLSWTLSYPNHECLYCENGMQCFLAIEERAYILSRSEHKAHLICIIVI